MIYAGTTYFGFFTRQALANQVGIRGAETLVYTPESDTAADEPVFIFPPVRPKTPDDPGLDPGTGLAMPASALRMLDRIVLYEPDGGSHGLGFVRGTKAVHPDEWFFKAHFYQDPVVPGSLGLESFLQLMKFAALERWPELVETHRFEMVTGSAHEWIYRGQVIPGNTLVTVEADMTRVDNEQSPALYADGFLKVDGIYIYQMKDFGLKLVPI
jgi:3-hydroxymyristoyl/3-hydroxydecanoyl-(acyl carrier protein) dehydratase